MQLDFDKGTGPQNPISTQAAIDRGVAIVVQPVYWIFSALIFVGVLVGMLARRPLLGSVIVLAGFVLGWLWWSYSVPRWRRWALGRGADPDELQRMGEEKKLVWPRGHILEKTEFPFRGR